MAFAGAAVTDGDDILAALDVIRSRQLQDQHFVQRRQRQEIFQVEDSIIEKRDGLINSLEKRLTQKTESERLFTIAWAVV